MPTNSRYDWRKITKKRGDTGKSDVLFGRRKHKSHNVFWLQAELEVTQVKLAKLRFVLPNTMLPEVLESHGEELRSVVTKFEQLKKDVGFDTSFRAIMGAVISFCDHDRYVETFKTKDAVLAPQKIQCIEQNIEELGSSMNALGIQPGWVDYSSMGTMGLSFAEATTQIRRTETIFYKFLECIESDLSHYPAPSYSLERQFLNRLSKVTHMYMAVLSEIESASEC